MDPSSQNTDKSQGGVETPRNPYARGNSFDRPGTEPKVQTAETIKAMQPEQPTAGPVFSAPDTTAALQTPVASAPTPSQHTVASGTGDIVLEPETPKKSKKPLIFAIIAIVLLVGAFITYTVVTSTKQTQQTVASTDVQADFNRYANYLLYGEDSDTSLEGEYDEEAVTELGFAVFSEDAQERQSFGKELKSMWSNFTKHNTNITLPDEYQSKLEFISSFLQVGKQLQYNDDFVDDEDYYEKLASSSSYGKKYIETLQKYADSYKKDPHSSESFQYYGEAEEILSDTITDLSEGCFVIKKEIVDEK